VVIESWSVQFPYFNQREKAPGLGNILILSEIGSYFYRLGRYLFLSLG